MNDQIDYNLNPYDNSPVLYIHLFDIRLPEDVLKKVEACRSMSALYVKVHILILVHFLGLPIKLFMNTRI
jgi:hypothetical protein